MNKLYIVLIVIGIVAVVAFYIALGPSREDVEAKKAWARRLEAAAAATDGERAIEGVIARVEEPLPVETVPDVAARAAWHNEKRSVRTEIRSPSDLQFQLAAFTLETNEGELVVDGELVGLADLVPRTHVDGEVTIHAVHGDAVTVFGTVTERDGVRGFYGDVLIVKAPLQKWIERSGVPLVSLPVP